MAVRSEDLFYVISTNSSGIFCFPPSNFFYSKICTVTFTKTPFQFLLFKCCIYWIILADYKYQVKTS